MHFCRVEYPLFKTSSLSKLKVRSIARILPLHECHSTVSHETVNESIRMENPIIPGRIQMERFIPVENFWKKSNTFRGITFFPFLPKRRKFFVPFVWLTSARLPLEAEGDLF